MWFAIGKTELHVWYELFTYSIELSILNFVILGGSVQTLTTDLEIADIKADIKSSGLVHFWLFFYTFCEIFYSALQMYENNLTSYYES